MVTDEDVTIDTDNSEMHDARTQRQHRREAQDDTRRAREPPVADDDGRDGDRHVDSGDEDVGEAETEDECVGRRAQLPVAYDDNP